MLLTVTKTDDLLSTMGEGAQVVFCLKEARTWHRLKRYAQFLRLLAPFVINLLLQ